jgi:hydrogenase nickel incorporation protein HypA/HybF
MHELSIALSIVDVAAEVAEGQGGGQVAAVRVKVGRLSGVVGSALVSAFTLAREGTPLDRAELIVEDVAAVAYCQACSAAHDPGEAGMLICPTCGGPTPELLHGRELEVVALEMDS